jgi:hypothetical protein
MNENNIKIIDTNCRQRRVQVPTSVNVKEIVKRLNLTPTRAENLKNKIYYFLSRIVSTNDNYKLNEDNYGYINISSVSMRKVMGRKDYYLILDSLINPEDPIIETNGSWQNSNGFPGKGHCKGYRLTQKYNTGEVQFKTLPDKNHCRILKHLRDEQDAKAITERYWFLLNQFDIPKLSFDPRVYDYIRSFAECLLSRVENENEFQTKMVLNLIGRWLYYVDRLEKHELWSKVSPDNHRLNSTITNLKKTLRPFLLFDGKPLGIIDISSSQPYLLSSVINKSFIEGADDGFNLKSIYPEVWKELVDSKSHRSTNLTSTYTGNTFKNYSSNDAHGASEKSTSYFEKHSSSGFTGNEISSISTGFSSYNSSIRAGNACFPSNHPSFMWGQFFNEEELESINIYQQSPFDNDFYKYLFDRFQSMTGRIEDFYPKQRKKLKGRMMVILFDEDPIHRNNIEYIKLFRKVFPGVDKWITHILYNIGKNKFSYLLQRAESYLVLNVVCREFHDKYPSAPIFTIHDAVITYEEYLPDLHRLILERFYETTGIKVGVKTKLEKPNPEPKPEDIEEEWQKIKSVTSLKKYNDQHFQIFSSNIQKGSIFLFPRKR